MPAYDDSQRLQLRETFGADPGAYDRARPTYPPALFEDLYELAHLPERSVGLEIGCGTGQATIPLASLVDELHVVELSQELLDYTRGVVSAGDRVHFHLGAFEQADLSSGGFDLVAAATAFHWLDPATRCTRAAQLLRTGGSLAIIHTHHLDGGTPGFHDATQPLYEQHLGERGNFALPSAVDVDAECLELRASNGFHEPRVRARVVEREFTSGEYADLLGTFSPMLALEPEARRAFLTDVSRLVDEKFGGAVRRRYGFSLVVAARR